MAQEPDISKLRLVSYNIRKARGLDGARDPGRILDILSGLDADVIALQEADRRLGARPAALPEALIEAETDFRVLRFARNEVSLGWHGNTILVRKGLKAAPVAGIDLPGLEPRGAVHARIGSGAGALDVVAAHLGLARRHRRRQLAHIAQHLEGAPLSLVLGDFNEWSAATGFEPFAGLYEIHAPGRSFHAARPIAALDRIALSPGLELRDAGVEQGTKARRASDHLPIWADVALPVPA